MIRRSLVSDALKRQRIKVVPDDREINILAGRRFEDDMTKTLKDELADREYEAGRAGALYSIKIDEGDLLGCCEDYAELEADGGGTAGKSLKEMLADAYYKGAELAVKRVKEGRWRQA